MSGEFESIPSVPRSLLALPGDPLNKTPNQLLRSLALELQGHIASHWEQQQDQWRQLRKELRQQHQELLQLLLGQRHGDLKVPLAEVLEERRATSVKANSPTNRPTFATSFTSHTTPPTVYQSQTQGKPNVRSSMFNWTTARLAKVESHASSQQLSASKIHLLGWLKKMFTVPPSFERRRGTKTVLENFVSTHYFQAFSGAIIISNSIYLGWYADFSVRNELRRIDWGSYDEPPWIGNIVFTLLLVLEVSMRFFCLGWKKYFKSNVFWNVIDLVLVILPVFSLFQPKDNVPRFSFWRIIRVFRLIHTAPLFRMPLFVHLRMITNALFMSMPAFVWAVVFGSFFLYMSGVGFCLVFAHELQNEQVRPGGVSPARDYFSNLADAMTHLYMALTNGVDWIQIYNATKESDPLMSLGLLCFSVFMVFAVVNIISAMFIERVFNVTKDDRDFWVVEEARRNELHRKRIFGLFDEMDKDGSGDVTWDEFEQALDDPHIEAYLSFVDLDVSNLHDIFQLLDKDKNGSVDIHEFLDGFEVLKGPAKRVEVLRMYELIRDLIAAEMSNLRAFTQGRRPLDSRITAEDGARPLNSRITAEDG